ncbi:hypothetical protein [Virgibacillus sp. 6R]|uniref:hypothetical protein n=1 Tax=Metabacillus sp. 22489 TaxID=3453928 RepID=UPI0011AA79D7
MEAIIVIVIIFLVGIFNSKNGINVRKNSHSHDSFYTHSHGNNFDTYSNTNDCSSFDTGSGGGDCGGGGD